MATEMSTVEQSQMESAASGTESSDKGAESHARGYLVAGICVAVVLSLIVVGVLLASRGKDEESDSDGDAADNGPGPTDEKNSDIIGTFEAKTTTTTVTTRTPRRRITKTRDIYCVVGERLVTDVVITSGSCDYVIYPDLALIEENFQAVHGHMSWKVFDKARNSSKFIAGASFLLTHADNPDSTVARIPQYEEKIDQLVTSGFHALGFLDVPINGEFKVDTLKPAFEVFDTALVPITQKSRTFMGVRMTSEDQFEPFAEEIKDMLTLDTIIIQVHNARTIQHEEACIFHQISYLGTEALSSAIDLPNYVGSENASKTIRTKGFKGQVFMSSSAGGMIYEFKKQQYNPTFNTACQSAVLVHTGFACEISNGSAGPLPGTEFTLIRFKGKGGNDTKQYVYIADDRIEKFKGTTFLKESDGWAIFNVELDTYDKCQNTQPGALVALMAKEAKKS